MMRPFFFILSTVLSIGIFGLGAQPAAAQYATPQPAATAAAQPATTAKKGPAPKATPAPPKDTTPPRVGISGVWEIQIQRPSGTTYTHFKIVQKDNVLTGEYLDTNNKKYPLFGSIDGKNVRVVVSLSNGATLTFNGSEDGLTDMIGMLAMANESVPFTAAYRPKYNWMDNLTPGAGGMGTPY